jgi:hypothetical protein
MQEEAASRNMLSSDDPLYLGYGLCQDLCMACSSLSEQSPDSTVLRARIHHIVSTRLSALAFEPHDRQRFANGFLRELRIQKAYAPTWAPLQMLHTSFEALWTFDTSPLTRNRSTTP